MKALYRQGGDELGTLFLSVLGLVVLGLALAVVRATPSLTWVAEAPDSRMDQTRV